MVSENAESSNVSVQPKVFDSSVQTCVETNGGVSDSFIPLYDVNLLKVLKTSLRHQSCIHPKIMQTMSINPSIKGG